MPQTQTETDGETSPAYVTDAPEGVSMDLTFQEAQALQARKEQAQRRRKELEAEAEAILAEELGEAWDEVSGLSLDTEAEDKANDKVKEVLRAPFKEAYGGTDTEILEAGNGLKAKVVPISFERVYFQNL